MQSSDHSVDGYSNFKQVEQVYENAWRKSAYSDFGPFDFLLRQRYPNSNTPIRWNEFIGDLNRDPNLKGSPLRYVGLSVEYVRSLNIDENLWKNNPGLCTCFSLRVADESNILPCATIGNHGNHRLVWTQRKDKKEAILIDSSLRKAVFLPNAYNKTVLRSECYQETQSAFRLLVAIKQ